MASGTKRIIRATWNGPFHIGKLSPPTSVGDVLLKVLETAWRLFLVAVSLLVAIGLSLVVWIYLLNPVFFSSLKDQVPAPASNAATPEPQLSLTTLEQSDWEKIGMGCSCSFTVGIPRQEKLIAGGDGLAFFRLNGDEVLCPAPETQAMFDGAVSMSCGATAVQVSPFGEITPGFDGHSSDARLNVASPTGTITLSGTWGCSC